LFGSRAASQAAPPNVPLELVAIAIIAITALAWLAFRHFKSKKKSSG
jgi:hypothetical protein